MLLRQPRYPTSLPWWDRWHCVPWLPGVCSYRELTSFTIKLTRCRTEQQERREKFLWVKARRWGEGRLFAKQCGRVQVVVRRLCRRRAIVGIGDPQIGPGKDDALDIGSLGDGLGDLTSGVSIE